ncbi:MAG: manganese efflux pump [Alicyclobacillus sp.]|nr:manganese efflux pump [Alicyclobacillus sp.]
MMGSHLLTVCAIALASNLDNAGVGIAYGVRRIHISWLANALIALISGIATLFAGWLGDALTHYIPERAAAWTGAVVIGLVGLWVLSDPWRRRWRKQSQNNVVVRILRDPTAADFDHSYTISLAEAAVLGFALALNALAGGFDAGVTHMGVVVTALAVALFSFILLGAAAYLGRRFMADSLGDAATYIAGLVLLAVAIHQVWQV